MSYHIISICTHHMFTYTHALTYIHLHTTPTRIDVFEQDNVKIA
jgi:hypothetical protein